MKAYEMMHHMERGKQPEPRSPMKWIVDTLKDLSVTHDEDSSEDSDSDNEPILVDPETIPQEHPYAQTETPLTISKYEIRQGFKMWPERTATSPLGRHLGHY